MSTALLSLEALADLTNASGEYVATLCNTRSLHQMPDIGVNYHRPQLTSSFDVILFYLVDTFVLSVSILIILISAESVAEISYHSK